MRGLHQEAEVKDGVILLLVTFILVTIGCIMYIEGSVGWGQLFLVMASGTAGGGVVMIIEHHHD